MVNSLYYNLILEQMRKCNRKSYLYRLIYISVYREYLVNEKFGTFAQTIKPSEMKSLKINYSSNCYYIIIQCKKSLIKPKLTEQTTKFQLDCVLWPIEIEIGFRISVFRSLLWVFVFRNFRIFRYICKCLQLKVLFSPYFHKYEL